VIRIDLEGKGEASVLFMLYHQSVTQSEIEFLITFSVNPTPQHSTGRWTARLTGCRNDNTTQFDATCKHLGLACIAPDRSASSLGLPRCPFRILRCEAFVPIQVRLSAVRKRPLRLASAFKLPGRTAQ
jgi:hypothetical protein